nr:hypothetical protein [Tanacetum cinerariifolium]
PIRIFLEQRISAIKGYRGGTLTTGALTPVTLGGELQAFGDGLRLVSLLVGEEGLVTIVLAYLGLVTMILGTAARGVTEMVRPLRAGERIRMDALEDSPTKVIDGKEFPINNISRVDGACYNSIVMHFLNAIIKDPKSMNLFFQ